MAPNTTIAKVIQGIGRTRGSEYGRMRTISTYCSIYFLKGDENAVRWGLFQGAETRVAKVCGSLRCCGKWENDLEGMPEDRQVPPDSGSSLESHLP